VIAGSEGDVRVAWSSIRRIEFTTVMSLDDGRPLLSGSAEEKAHSSSSSADLGAGAVAGGLKSNIEPIR